MMRRLGWLWLLLNLGTAAFALGAVPPDLGDRQAPVKPRGDSGRVRPAAQFPLAAALPGETIAEALPITTLPFAVSGETCAYRDDYDAVCDWWGSAPDVVYAFTPPHAMQLDIDLCGSAYDTKVFLLDASLNVLACNDDYYGPSHSCGTYVSRLLGAPVSGGQEVYIVIDGYETGCGAYQLNVSEFVPCELACTGETAEGEPTLHDYYEDRFNGGCNSPGLVPAITTLNGDEAGKLSFCGVSGFYGGTAEHRDTDWFAITLGPTGEVVWQLDAEQTTLGYVVALSCPDPGVYGLLVGGPCQTGGLTIIGQPGAQIGLWVAPPVYTPPLNMLDQEYGYQFTLSGLSPHQAVRVRTVTWGTVKGLYR